MPKFTFICEDDPMPFSTGVVTKRIIEFEAVQLNDVVSEFELFLRGAGFNPPGILDFVQNGYSEPEWNTEEWDTPQDDISDKSPYYFNTERNK